MSDDDKTATHLNRLGVHPITIMRLRGYAELDGQPLRDLVRYILSDYTPATESDPKASGDDW